MLTLKKYIALIFILLSLTISYKVFALQNPTFKDKSAIFYYTDRPRHYSERADSVKIRLINEATNFEKTLDLTRMSTEIWKIVIPMSFLYREQGISRYVYYYYFLVDGKKVLDPTNKIRSIKFQSGPDGRVSFFRVEHRKRKLRVIRQNPEIVSRGLIFYYTKEIDKKIRVKLLISDQRYWSKVYILKRNTDGMLYAFVEKEDLPQKNIHNRFVYKFIVNGKYELDPLNPNQHQSIKGGIFNLVDLRGKRVKIYELPQNPVIKMQGIYFYCFAPNARKVGLLTNLNGWTHILPMSKSKDPKYKGAWVILLSKRNRDLPLNAGTYKYKFIVDGIITHDKNNPHSYDDGMGEKISVFTLKKPINYYGKNPIHIKNNIYRFFFMSRRAKHVFLLGSFNNWNPFNLKMKRINKDLFVVDVELHPGVYFYIFSVDNKWKNDPRNTNVAYNQVNRRVSIVLIKRRRKVIK